jgi:DNA-binding Lrp family transcriptional regulator
MNGLFEKFRLRKADRSDATQVKSFKEDQKKEAAYDYQSRGVRMVPVNRIVGSVGKYHDFDDRFRLKPHLPPERLENIKTALRAGKSLPPVDLYQIKDEYYVLDGNHRVAAAKHFGHDDILARIIEFIPSKDSLENMVYKERLAFCEKTGLPPSIELTELGQYAHLNNQILKHQKFLAEHAGKPIPLKTAAKDWHETIYRPLTAMIKKGGLVESFAGRTLSDLYAYISFYQWEMEGQRRYGIGISTRVPKNMEVFREKMADLNESEYPEMKRIILAFVLMNVKASRETRIIDKLYTLDQVQEVHSVHGDVDILAKIVLTRDLLSSDAEVISDFVHTKIRQIPGVVSTQTLIPGVSKMKPPTPS